jgi:NAD+ diphosphatase
LLQWQATHRYCGRCGAPLSPIRAGHAARCTGCDSEHYPRTDTAVIVSVTDGERLLLGRQSSWPLRRYSVIAGFLEPGERLEDAVEREVFEETGLRVRASRYAGSQPWPFPANLMVGFEAQADGDEPRFGGELEDARWFSAADIHAGVAAGELLLSPRLSIASWLIRRWLAQHAAQA